MALRIAKKNKSKNARKASKAPTKRTKEKKTLRDFYGALKDVYGDTDWVAYQRKLRDE
ncbi:MAG TPA: hypothetical protein VGD40_24040 [Chryseosolibacter sp.]